MLQWYNRTVSGQTQYLQLDDSDFAASNLTSKGWVVGSPPPAPVAIQISSSQPLEQIVFSRGSSSPGGYQNIGSLPSNQAGFLVNGSALVVKLICTTQNVVTGSDMVMQLQGRITGSGWSDIPGANVTISVGQYTASNTVQILVGPYWELACYVKSGNTTGVTVTTVYLDPQ